MDSRQQTRDKQASLLVHDWCVNGYTGEQLLVELCAYANDLRHLDFTPHLVTALREAELWPAIQLAELGRA